MLMDRITTAINTARPTGTAVTAIIVTDTVMAVMDITPTTTLINR